MRKKSKHASQPRPGALFCLPIFALPLPDLGAFFVFAKLLEEAPIGPLVGRLGRGVRKGRNSIRSCNRIPLFQAQPGGGPWSDAQATVAAVDCMREAREPLRALRPGKAERRRWRVQ